MKESHDRQVLQQQQSQVTSDVCGKHKVWGIPEDIAQRASCGTVIKCDGTFVLTLSPDSLNELFINNL